MFARKFVFACALLMFSAGVAYPQGLSETTVVPLIVDKGVPLQVTLTETLHLKENETVRARIIEPVYAFDREVIASGTEVEGRITGFEGVGKWKRISAMLGGDFTPIREPQITFHTLVLRDGTRIPIETVVAAGSEKTVGLYSKGSNNDLKSALTSTVKQSPGNTLRKTLWGMSPYHPRSLAAGTNLDAVLVEPLDFGVAVFAKQALAAVGSQLPEDTTVSARLVNALDSRVARPGASIEAVLTRPIFSLDHQLIFPAGSTLHGQVMDVSKARSFHRNGQLSFTFTTLETPALSWSTATHDQAVEGSLFSTQVNHQMKNLRIDENGTRIVEPKTRFIAPAWSFISVDRAFGASSHSFDEALLGAYRSKFLKQFVGHESTFGLVGSITGAMVPPVAISLGIVGAARSVHSNFIGRGRDIEFPANTLMQIHLTNAAANVNIQ